MKIQNLIKIPACAEPASAGRQNSKFKIPIFLTVAVFIIALLVFAPLQISYIKVSAQSDSTFTIGQQIMVENPPEAPQNLTATAVSSSQIDLTWDASVEGDLPVNGYKIFRDDVQIDSTAGTSYSDTGLNPDTLYTYKVSAFDNSGAESPFSDPASATTFPAPVDDDDEEEEEEPPVSSGGSSMFLRVLSFSLEPGLDRAVLNLETNLPSKSIIKWGETIDYEIGSLVTGVFEEKYQILISELSPSSVYFFRLEIFDALGRKIILDNQQFRTLGIPEVPFNVSNLKALADEEKITLTWKNPKIDFEAIRIIRSDRFFPRDPFDGELIYESRGEKFVDKEVEKRKDYFYAVFVRDKNGKYSSGALVRSRLLIFGEPIPDLFAGVIDLPPSEVDPLFLQLRLKDFEFIQEGENAQFENQETVVIKGDRFLKVSLPYEKVPEVLKTLTVTLTHPADPSLVFSFLLRVNDDRNAYEASIAPLGEEGVFGLHVAVLDHKNRGLKKITGILKSILPFPMIFDREFPWFSIFFWMLSLLLMIVLLWRLRPKVLKINYESVG